jgi:hypothetical protein
VKPDSWYAHFEMFMDFTDLLNESPFTFPVLECLHILGFTVSLGTIALVDLRVLGVGMQRESPAEIAKYVAPWTLFAIGSVLLSGPLLFISDPDMYYPNRAFQIKMILLVLAIVFNYTVHRNMIQSGESSKLIALLSLALWIGVIFGGIFIAFI